MANGTVHKKQPSTRAHPIKAAGDTHTTHKSGGAGHAHGAPKLGTAKGAKTTATEKVSAVGTPRADAFRKPSKVEAAPPPQVDPVPAALNRALFTMFKGIEDEETALNIAKTAARDFAKSPAAMAVLKNALPYIEKGAVAVSKQVGSPKIASVAQSALPLVANGKTAKALLRMASDIGGPQGRKLMSALIRGVSTGGATGGAASVIAAAAKIGSKMPALGPVATAIGKALPVLGNVANVLALGSSIKALFEAAMDTKSGKSLSERMAVPALHTACTVGGCFYPPATLVSAGIDLKETLAPGTPAAGSATSKAATAPATQPT